MSEEQTQSGKQPAARQSVFDVLLPGAAKEVRGNIVRISEKPECRQCGKKPSLLSGVRKFGQNMFRGLDFSGLHSFRAMSSAEGCQSQAWLASMDSGMAPMAYV
jgi:hypothetical protein